MSELALQRLTFAAHLQELRNRLFVSVFALLAGSALAYAVHNWIIALIQRPLREPLYYSSPTGGLQFLITICVAFGLLFAAPIIVYELIRFLEPAIGQRSTKLTVLAVTSSVLLLAIGVGFGYYLSLPAALHFLGGFATGGIHPLISTNEYLNFVLLYLVGFGLIFQLPLLLLLINRVTPLGPGKLLRYEDWVIVTSFVIAAIITPTQDPWNMTIMAAPAIVLYQFSILIIWLVNRRRLRRDRRREAAEQALLRRAATPPPVAPVSGRADPFPLQAAAYLARQSPPVDSISRPQ